MVQYSYPIAMELAGSTAIWTRADTGDSPVSYPAPTPSAVRGIFESIAWGADVKIIPRKVEICAPIQYHSYATNYGGPLRSSQAMLKGNNYQLFATVLVDVCYRLYADVVPNRDKHRLPQSALQWDMKTTSPGHAYQEIFNRRLKRGQSYANLFLGWKEFTPSYFGPFREETRVYTDMPDIPIPSMLCEAFSKGYNTDFAASYMQNLVIHGGTLIYPERSEAYDS